MRPTATGNETRMPGGYNIRVASDPNVRSTSNDATMRVIVRKLPGVVANYRPTADLRKRASPCRNSTKSGNVNIQRTASERVGSRRTKTAQDVAEGNVRR